MKVYSYNLGSVIAFLGLVVCGIGWAVAVEPVYFDTDDTGTEVRGDLIRPWKVVELDGDYGGQWVVAGDIDGDNVVEIVSAENFNQGDVHYTSAVVAQKLDGTVLWKWGDPAIGRKNWHHDVACQIHDFSGDDKNEVVVCIKGFIVELDGTTGNEIRRIPIADDATDCLVFCNLVGSGKPAGMGKARDVLVKDRYRNIYAYNRWGNLLWKVKDPGGYRTAHQPVPVDLDRDGHDEIMAGYAMLNHDGSVRWTFESKTIDQNRGHLDCVRILRYAENPEDFRLVLTCCGANNITMVDGNGKVLWEKSGMHFESIDTGKVFGDHAGAQLLVDIDHQPFGKSPMCVIDDKGTLLGRITTDYSRHHHLLDWTGDGADEIAVAYNGAIYDHTGERIACLVTASEDSPAVTAEKDAEYRSMVIGDIDGDQIRDILLVTTSKVYIYKNINGKPDKSVPLGTGANLTLY